MSPMQKRTARSMAKPIRPLRTMEESMACGITLGAAWVSSAMWSAPSMPVKPLSATPFLENEVKSGR